MVIIEFLLFDTVLQNNKIVLHDTNQFSYITPIYIQHIYICTILLLFNVAIYCTFIVILL